MDEGGRGLERGAAGLKSLRESLHCPTITQNQDGVYWRWRDHSEALRLDPGITGVFSISSPDLFIERFCMTGGNSPICYLKAYHTNLYLSADAEKVREAIDQGESNWGGRIWGVWQRGPRRGGLVLKL